jgi:putative ABC transport system ATP-binding protein
MVDESNLSKLTSDELAEYRNSKIGFVFQFFNLIPYLTAIENVKLPLSLAGADPETCQSKAMELLELFAIPDMADKKPTELSGGERQRVAITRALVNSPKLLLGDEPTGNIDSKNAMVIMDTFRQLVDEKGVSVIMVTHDLELLKLSDRIIKLRDGRLEGMEVNAN